MSRKPLSSRNAEHPPRRGAPGPKSKKKGRGFTINIAILVSDFNNILNEVNLYGPVVITEDDLRSPATERIQVIYLKILNFCFDVTLDSLKQAGFQTHPLSHPELCEEFIYRMQFFRAMKRFMKTCLIDDFRMEDIFYPESHRTCRIMSAIDEYVKFHFNVFQEDSELESLTQSRDDIQEDNKELVKVNTELREELAQLRLKREEEHDEEEELKKRILSQGQVIQEKRQSEEYLQERLAAATEEKKASEQRLVSLTEELEKSLMRLDTLSRKVVTSPDKLKGNRSRLQKECGELVASSRETENLQRMWEALASQAKQVPNGVLLSLEQNLDSLTKKVEKKNVMALQYDSTEEETGSLSRQLREMKQKHLKLLQFLKLQEEEKDRLACQNMTISHSRSSEDTQKEIVQVKQEIEEKLMMEKKYSQMSAALEKEQADDRTKAESALREIDAITQQLLQAYKVKSSEYEELLKSLGIQLS